MPLSSGNIGRKFKHGDDVTSGSAEGFETRDNEFPLKRRTLAERYAKGDLLVHLHLAVRDRRRGGENAKITYLCAVTKSAETGVPVPPKVGIRRLVNVDSGGLGDGSSNRSQLVLVGDVESIEALQSFPVPPGCITRLQPLNECLRTRPDTSDLIITEPVGVDGELGPGVSERGAAESLRHLPHSVIESGAEVVDAIPDDEPPGEFGGFAKSFGCKDISGVFRIELLGDRIGVTFQEPLDLLVEQFEVFVSPPQFGSGTFQSHGERKS